MEIYIVYGDFSYTIEQADIRRAIRYAKVGAYDSGWKFDHTVLSLMLAGF